MESSESFIFFCIDQMTLKVSNQIKGAEISQELYKACWEILLS